MEGDQQAQNVPESPPAIVQYESGRISFDAKDMVNAVLESVEATDPFAETQLNLNDGRGGTVQLSGFTSSAIRFTLPDKEQTYIISYAKLTPETKSAVVAWSLANPDAKGYSLFGTNDNITGGIVVGRYVGIRDDKTHVEFDLAPGQGQRKNPFIPIKDLTPGTLSALSVLHSKDEGISTLRLNTGKTAKVQLTGVDGTNVQFTMDGKPRSAPLAAIAPEAQGAIRQIFAPQAPAEGLPKTPDTSEGVAVYPSGHPLIPAIRTNETVPSDLEKLDAISSAFTLQYPEGQGSTARPIFNDRFPTIFEATVQELGDEALVAPPESPTVSRGSFRMNEGVTLLNGIPVTGVIVRGDLDPENPGAEAQARQLTIILTSKNAARIEAHASGTTEINESDVERAVRDDYKKATSQLNELFGSEPKKQSFGTNPFSRNQALRWDWNGQAFLLIEHDDREYSKLVITTTAEADAQGVFEPPTREQIATYLEQSVHSNEAGFTWIEGIPLTDQSDVNFCAPATGERLLTHLAQTPTGSSYMLDLAAECKTGALGTLPKDLISGLQSATRGSDCKVDTQGFDFDTIVQNIEDGIPMIWLMSNSDSFKNISNTLTTAWAGVADSDLNYPERMTAAFEKMDSAPPSVESQANKGTEDHALLITGVNKKTGHIIASQSYGFVGQKMILSWEDAQRLNLNGPLISVRPK